ncbi:hypothetical protein DY000_02030250 [Brassica cretica]|uniref:Uncharacterized protein n=1 Tax=Brassica cretica TaxID=69181 RepID=A0ABQ7DW23_BRACR|nr:hypothetical protein DY000_02030250 [Brassica cretica]
MLTPIKVESKTSLCSSTSVTWSLPITLVASSPSLSLYVRIAPNTAQSLHSRDPVELLVPCGSPHGSNQSERGKVRGGRSKRAASASRLMRSLFQMCVGYFVLLDSSRWLLVVGCQWWYDVVSTRLLQQLARLRPSLVICIAAVSNKKRKTRSPPSDTVDLPDQEPPATPTVSLLSGRLHEFVSEANSSWNCSGRVVFGFEDTYTERARTQCGVKKLGRSSTKAREEDERDRATVEAAREKLSQSWLVLISLSFAYRREETARGSQSIYLIFRGYNSLSMIKKSPEVLRSSLIKFLAPLVASGQVDGGIYLDYNDFDVVLDEPFASLIAAIPSLSVVTGKVRLRTALDVSCIGYLAVFLL